MQGAVSIKKLFLVVIILKVSSTLLGAFIVSPWGPWGWGFAVPMLLMAAYVLLGLKKRDADELSDEKFADSCYYLGFIFTISSIVICLFDLPSLGGRLADIAIRFGAAMVSTVVGLTVRVYLVNFKKDTYDIVRSVEDELHEAAKALRVKLDLAIQQLGEFCGTVDDSTRTATARVNLAIESAAAEYSDKFSKLFEEITAGNKNASEEALAHTRDASEKLGKMVEGHAETLSKSTNKFRITLDDFIGDLKHRLDKVKFPEDYFVEALAEPVGRLKDSVSNISTEIELTVSGLKGGSEKVNRALNKVSENATNLSTAMDKSTEIIEAQYKVVGLAKDQIETLSKLSGSAERLEASVGRTADSHRKQDELLGKITDDVARITRTHEEMLRHSGQQQESIQAISQKLGEVNTSLDKVQKILPDDAQGLSLAELLEKQETSPPKRWGMWFPK